jgi:hypothetical protein
LTSHADASERGKDELDEKQAWHRAQAFGAEGKKSGPKGSTTPEER